MSEDFPRTFGRYELLDRLAVGGMAELFLARSSGSDGFEKTVVIKRILPHLAADEHFTTMFIAEGKLTSGLSHPNIAQTHELGREGDQLYMVMEYIDGLDTLAILRECAHRRVRLPVEIAVFIVKEVLDALEFAHRLVDDAGRPRGIVHRDISPSNILISRRGDVKLVDFGIAHAAADDRGSQAGALKGKYGYMSPEQVLNGQLTERSDLFSAGIVLAELLMGRRLFAAASELDVLLMVRDVKLDRLARFGSNIESRLLELLLKALRKDARERYGSAAEFRDVLADWLFESRARVSSEGLAEIIESLYDDANERRRIALESGSAPAAGVEGLAARGSVARADAEIDGIPSGERRVTDSVPTVVVDEESTGIQSLEISLAEVGELDGVGSVSDDGIPITIEGEAEMSMRFPSISAAVASVNPSGLDPAALEFDGTELSDAAIEPPARRVSGQMPSVAEVAAASKPAPPQLEKIDVEPEQSGDLGVTPAIAILFRFIGERETGLLVVEVEDVRKEIYFVDGCPEFVSSNAPTELFGNYLVQAGALSSGELDMALAVMPHYGGKLGDTLVGLGLMKPLDVFRHLAMQVRVKLLDVCTWQRGDYSWYPGQLNTREAFPLDIDAVEVLGAGAMALADDFIQAWGEALGNMRPRSCKSAKLVPELFLIGREARAVYDMLDGTRSVTVLAHRYTDEEERNRFLRMLFLFMNTGLAEDVR